MSARYAMLIQTNAGENHNKFYEVTLEDNGQVWARWGRVGAQGQRGLKGNGERAFHAAVRAKTSSGYQPVDIAVADVQTGKPQTSLVEVAKRYILGSQNDPTLVALIERLTALNSHQLMAVSGGKIQIIDGQVKTPLGLVTSSTVLEARRLLNELQAYVAKKQLGSSYSRLLDEYLMKIPQRIPARRGWDQVFFSEFTTFNRQVDLLDQLEESIKLAQQGAGTPASDEQEEAAQIFGYQLGVCDDTKVFKQVDAFYRANINPRHVSAHLKLKRIFTVANTQAEAAFRAKTQAMEASRYGSNIQRYWHGTRAHNVLSILKSGLIIPKYGDGIHITARMFGNGVYFSDQSSKSLNYAYGYWDHGNYEHNCYMLLCDVAMGRSHTPKTSGNGDRRKEGYDSCFAKAGVSSVLNNEMIVYDTSQVQLRYLCEFDR